MLSRSVIAKWENNTAVPDVDSLIKLSRVFNVSLDHLVGNYSFQNDLLKEFKRIYSSEAKDFDEDVVELVEYLMTYPEFKNQVYRLKRLSIKKQLSLHNLITQLLNEYENL